MMKRICRFLLAVFWLITSTKPLHAQWVPTGGLYNGVPVLCFTVSGTILVAGTSSGVFLSTNGGSWTAVSGTNLLAGTYGGGVFLSTNKGARWTAVD